MAIGRVNSGAGGTGKSAIIVTAPTGSAVTCTDGTVTKTASERDGTWTFKNCGIGTWTVTATLEDQTATKTVEIAEESQLMRYGVKLTYEQIPEFTYTGDYEIVNDDDEPISTSDGNWKIRFLTSGTLTFTDLKGAEDGIDVFCVGGGGGSTAMSSGGGGGYTNTTKNIQIETGTEYEIVVASGGAVSSNGGSSSAFGLNAGGGYRGWAYSSSSGGATGGNGGSGGAGYGYDKLGGTDGGSGGGWGGSGQKSVYGPNGENGTTREFGEEDGKLYSNGGDGGSCTNPSSDTDNSKLYPNSGYGAHGGDIESKYGGVGTPGASGIVIIRNTRG